MASSKIAAALEGVVKNSANLVANMQIGANEVLWGKTNVRPTMTAKYTPSTDPATPGTITYTTKIPAQQESTRKGVFTTGIYGVLDALLSVDLCQVLTYVYDTANLKKTPRPEPPWTPGQKRLYELQDTLKVVQGYVDTYLAYSDRIISSYTAAELGSQQGTVEGVGGTDVTRYNTFFLMRAVLDTLGPVLAAEDGLLSAEDKALLQTVPTLTQNTTLLDDLLGTFRKYTDYRQIRVEDLDFLQKKITTLRAVCVTVQALDFRSAAAVIGNVLNRDIRSQVQRLQKSINPTQIVPTLKTINTGVRTFIRVGRQVQGIVTRGQFLIKLGLLLYKVFKFILIFIGLIPVSGVFMTVGGQTKIQDAKNQAKDETDGVMRVLRAVNALLQVATDFIRYVLANANEIAVRLERLLETLKGCEAVSDSEVIKQLDDTVKDLKNLQEELAAYITKYDSKTDATNTTFGGYDIRVIDEEVVETTVRAKRRRGIALDLNGAIVVSSDLTFATNTAVIVEEVKQKLVAAGLVRPDLGVVDGANLQIISTSLTYLDNNDILETDLTISQETLNLLKLDATESVGNDQGTGLNAFINNLPGGKKLRESTKSVMTALKADVTSKIDREKAASNEAFRTG